jgi:hypothetical protein
LAVGRELERQRAVIPEGAESVALEADLVAL